MGCCPKCGAPQGIIGWLCDCWSTNNPVESYGRVEHEKITLGRNTPVYSKRSKPRRYMNVTEYRVDYLVILEKGKWLEIAHHRNVWEYAVGSKVIGHKPYTNGMRKIKLSSLPKIVKKLIRKDYKLEEK